MRELIGGPSRAWESHKTSLEVDVKDKGRVTRSRARERLFPVGGLACV